MVYGSPRIHRVLTASGESVCENTVAKVMQRESIRAKTNKKFVPRTTDSRHDYPVYPNVLDRQFDAPAPNRKWATDITYIPTDEGVGCTWRGCWTSARARWSAGRWRII